MGVELNALETAKAAADEPKRYRLISLLHILKAELPIVVHDGKLTVVRLVQEAKALAPIVVHDGKLAVVRL